nr:hypothetical protein [Arthrospira sp. PLM2.Bin9]
MGTENNQISASPWLMHGLDYPNYSGKEDAIALLGCWFRGCDRQSLTPVLILSRQKIII